MGVPVFDASSVTLCVPAHQSSELLIELFNRVRALHKTPSRILLIDDGAKPPLNLSGVETIRHACNKGLAAARNTALENCTTPLIAFLDSDVFPESQWLEALLSAMESTNAAGVGGKLLESFDRGLGNQWRCRHMSQHWGDAMLQSPKFIYGANCLYDVAALRSVGGFDNRYRTHDEDRDVSIRLKEAGLKLAYTPHAVALHQKRNCWSNVLNDYWHWHYSKGLIAGDYDSPEGLLKRIEIVAFGLSRYRLHLDNSSEGQKYRFLDAMIPFVFFSRDLDLLHERTGLAVPGFPHDKNWRELLPENVKPIFDRLCPSRSSSTTLSWHESLLSEFDRCLAQTDWFKEAAIDQLDPDLYAITETGNES